MPSAKAAKRRQLFGTSHIGHNVRCALSKPKRTAFDVVLLSSIYYIYIYNTLLSNGGGLLNVGADGFPGAVGRDELRPHNPWSTSLRCIKIDRGIQSHVATVLSTKTLGDTTIFINIRIYIDVLNGMKAICIFVDVCKVQWLSRAKRRYIRGDVVRMSSEFYVYHSPVAAKRSLCLNILFF